LLPSRSHLRAAFSSTPINGRRRLKAVFGGNAKVSMFEMAGERWRRRAQPEQAFFPRLGQEAMGPYQA